MFIPYFVPNTMHSKPIKVKILEQMARNNKNFPEI